MFKYYISHRISTHKLLETSVKTHIV